MQILNTDNTKAGMFFYDAVFFLPQRAFFIKNLRRYFRLTNVMQQRCHTQAAYDILFQILFEGKIETELRELLSCVRRYQGVWKPENPGTVLRLVQP